jgi:predicted chitinase
MENILERLGERSILATCKLPITQQRLDNLPYIVQGIETSGIDNMAQVAYILATVAHECSFRCIEEIRARPNTAVWHMQEKYWHTGYYGRGFCQLTWKKNYEKFQDLLEIPLVGEPALALDPTISAQILVKGMRDGLFSGKKLSDYITDTTRDFTRARRVVNGNFQADRVAAHAERLYTLLR